MKLYYQKERDICFFNSCEKIRKENRGNYLSVEKIARQAAQSPAKSFFISPRTCERIISIILGGGENTIKSKSRREMYSTIAEKYRELKSKYPCYSTRKIATLIAEEAAPRFYMSDARARDLYYELLRDKSRR